MREMSISIIRVARFGLVVLLATFYPVALVADLISYVLRTAGCPAVVARCAAVFICLALIAAAISTEVGAAAAAAAAAQLSAFRLSSASANSSLTPEVLFRWQVAVAADPVQATVAAVMSLGAAVITVLVAFSLWVLRALNNPAACFLTAFALWCCRVSAEAQ